MTDSFISNLFDGTRPNVANQTIFHRPSDLDRSMRWSQFRSSDRRSKKEIFSYIQNLSSDYYPHLYETIASKVYERWISIFLKSWNSRFKSRWLNSNKMVIVYPGGGGIHYRGLSTEMIPYVENKQVPPFRIDYQEGCNLPHFRRYLQEVTREPYWEGDYLGFCGWLSYCCPENVSSDHQFHLPYRGLDSYDWKLNKSEVNHAQETRILI